MNFRDEAQFSSKWYNYYRYTLNSIILNRDLQLFLIIDDAGLYKILPGCTNLTYATQACEKINQSARDIWTCRKSKIVRRFIAENQQNSKIADEYVKHIVNIVYLIQI